MWEESRPTHPNTQLTFLGPRLGSSTHLRKVEEKKKDTADPSSRANRSEIITS